MGRTLFCDDTCDECVRHGAGTPTAPGRRRCRLQSEVSKKRIFGCRLGSSDQGQQDTQSTTGMYISGPRSSDSSDLVLVSRSSQLPCPSGL